MSTEIQVALRDIQEKGGQPARIEAVELGGRGKVVELWAIHYQLYAMGVGATISSFVGMGLSSNPELLRQGGLVGYSLAALSEDRSVYGRATWMPRETHCLPSRHISASSISKRVCR